jgi:hypothetical protein
LVWLAGKEFLGSEPWKRWWINFVFLTWENGKRMTRSLRAMKAKSQGYQPCVYDCRCQPHKANKQRWHVKSETYIVSVFCPRLWALKLWAKIEKRGKNRKYLGYTIK